MDLGFNPVIEKEQGRLFLLLEGKEPEVFFESLNHVFGISSYSPARKVDLDLEGIKEAAL